MSTRLSRGLVAACTLAAAAAVAQDEVPFITTPDNVTQAMLELAGVSAADRLVDLGSGDGRIVITAARRFGTRGLGVEIVPELVARSRENAHRAGVAPLVEFREQDLFATDLRGFTVVTMYLLPAVNLQLRPRLLALPPGTRIVSHDWDLGDWTPDRSLTVDAPDKPIGREKKSTLHLWTVPAAVAGRWCGVPAGRPSAAGATLQIDQRFQRFSATLERPGLAAPQLVFDGRIEGTLLTAANAAGPHTRLRLDGTRLRVERIDAVATGLEGSVFSRDCPR